MRLPAFTAHSSCRNIEAFGGTGRHRLLHLLELLQTGALSSARAAPEGDVNMRYLVCIVSAWILGGALLTSLSAKTGSAVAVQIVNTTPFTDTTVIPADADTRSIRFESLKTVHLPSRIRYTTDPAWCDRGSQEPGGSAFCPQAQLESSVSAVELTYSYSGSSLGSDEHAGGRLTFEVYLRPSDIPATLREEISAGHKPDRAQLAAYFEVSVRRDPAPRYILDPSRSYVCPGTYIDGNWQPDDPDCDIIIRSKKVQGLSDFLTVRVTPLSP